MAPPRVTLASLQKNVSEVLGTLEGLEEVVAAVRESVEEIQTQANNDHENHVGTCQQLQRSVDDIMQLDPASDGEGVSRAQRADAKDDNAAWRNDVIRRFWILTAERPAMYNLKRLELQAVLAEVTAVTDRVTNQLNTLTRFAVTAYMAERGDTSAAGDMLLPEQMDVMVQYLLIIIGTGVESDTSGSSGCSLWSVHFTKVLTRSVSTAGSTRESYAYRPTRTSCVTWSTKTSRAGLRICSARRWLP